MAKDLISTPPIDLELEEEIRRRKKQGTMYVAAAFVAFVALIFLFPFAPIAAILVGAVLFALGVNELSSASKLRSDARRQSETQLTEQRSPALSRDRSPNLELTQDAAIPARTPRRAQNQPAVASPSVAPPLSPPPVLSPASSAPVSPAPAFAPAPFGNGFPAPLFAPPPSPAIGPHVRSAPAGSPYPRQPYYDPSYATGAASYYSPITAADSRRVSPAAGIDTDGLRDAPIWIEQLRAYVGQESLHILSATSLLRSDISHITLCSGSVEYNGAIVTDMLHSTRAAPLFGNPAEHLQYMLAHAVGPLEIVIGDNLGQDRVIVFDPRNGRILEERLLGSAPRDPFSTSDSLMHESEREESFGPVVAREELVRPADEGPALREGENVIGVVYQMPDERGDLLYKDMQAWNRHQEELRQQDLSGGVLYVVTETMQGPNAQYAYHYNRPHSAERTPWQRYDAADLEPDKYNQDKEMQAFIDARRAALAEQERVTLEPRPGVLHLSSAAPSLVADRSLDLSPVPPTEVGLFAVPLVLPQVYSERGETLVGVVYHEPDQAPDYIDLEDWDRANQNKFRPLGTTLYAVVEVQQEHEVPTYLVFKKDITQERDWEELPERDLTGSPEDEMVKGTIAMRRAVNEAALLRGQEGADHSMRSASPAAASAQSVFDVSAHPVLPHGSASLLAAPDRSVELAAAPRDIIFPEVSATAGDAPQRLGMTVSGNNPLIVTDVEEDSLAQKLGIQAGDEIVYFNDDPFYDPSASSSAEGREQVLVALMRSGAPCKVIIVPAGQEPKDAMAIRRDQKDVWCCTSLTPNENQWLVGNGENASAYEYLANDSSRRAHSLEALRSQVLVHEVPLSPAAGKAATVLHASAIPAVASAAPISPHPLAAVLPISAAGKGASVGVAEPQSSLRPAASIDHSTSVAVSSGPAGRLWTETVYAAPQQRRPAVAFDFDYTLVPDMLNNIVGQKMRNENKSEAIAIQEALAQVQNNPKTQAGFFAGLQAFRRVVTELGAENVFIATNNHYPNAIKEWVKIALEGDQASIDIINGTPESAHKDGHIVHIRMFERDEVPLDQASTNKNLHLRYISDNFDVPLRDITLVDDNQENIEGAQSLGCKVVKVTVNPKPKEIADIGNPSKNLRNMLGMSEGRSM